MGKKLTKEQFIERIEIKFGVNKFDYSQIEYKDAHTNINLICKTCGNIENKPPSVWYRGFGCLKCQNRRPNPKQVTKEQFIERSNKIHNFKYDYSNIKYEGLFKEVEIVCANHGGFYQLPSIHIYAKSNCPECRTSKGEEQIAIWLNKNKIDYIFQHQIKINNSYHYFDFYTPDKNLIIEFNGKQHYQPIKFFGGEKGFKYLQERDKIKEQYCLDNNIKLLNISYKDDINNILKSNIKN